MTDFTVDQANVLLGEAFAPWILDLGLEVTETHDEGAVMRLPFSESLCRAGGIICGQALMALADTAMVFAISAAGGRFRPMSTVDQTTHFLKPAAKADVIADARVIRMGRTMAFGTITLKSAADTKAVATVQIAYALLPE